MHCEPVRQRRRVARRVADVEGSMPIGGVSSAAAGGGSAAAARFARRRPGRVRGRVPVPTTIADGRLVLGSGLSAAGSSTSLRHEWRATTGVNTLARTHARADPRFERIGSPGGTPSERIGGGGLVPQPLAGQSTLDLIAAATAAARAWTTRWRDVARAHCHGRRQRDAPPPPPPRARCHHVVILHARAHAAAAAAAAARVWTTRWRDLAHAQQTLPLT